MDKDISDLNDEDSLADFCGNKSIIKEIFFPNDSDGLFRRDSDEYKELWSFLNRFQSFQRRKLSQMTSTSSSAAKVNEDSVLQNIENKRQKKNWTRALYRMQDYIRHREGKKIYPGELTDDQIRYFRVILLMYFDFLHKEKVRKLQKIRQDRESLPIYLYKSSICSAVDKQRVLVIAGDTGCGKSTQVPQYLAEHGYAKICVTQPRRIACISLAARVNFENSNKYGNEVGYQVRFEKNKSKATRILFLTEGLLLRQLQSDSYLKQYDVIILDEVHERHVHTDFLLGVLHCLVRSRDDVKVILMSATINVELFSNYFNSCPIIKVPGRLYPIELQYQPIKVAEQPSQGDRLDASPYLRLLQNIDHKYPPNERGDLLIFLAGMSDIQTIVDAATQYAQKSKRWIILPLHSSLSIREQDKVFDVAPEGVRKCIVSTNIAETSVTIDGVRFVADSGYVKEISWDSATKMQRLKQFWVSRASAEQRKGRAGRTGPGVCFRLYSEQDYATLQEFSTPEIKRVPLESLVLQMISMGLPDVRRFPFLEPPSSDSLELSIESLKQHGAVTHSEVLTPMGELLSELPIEIVLGKLLILASAFHLVEPVLSLAAALSVQSPYTSKAFIDVDMISSRKSLESTHGDTLTLMNIFDTWVRLKSTEGSTNSKKWCKRRGLEEQRLYEMVKLRNQFRELLIERGLLRKTSSRHADGFHHTPQRDRLSQQRRKSEQRKKLNRARREQRSGARKRKFLKIQDGIEFSDGSDNDSDNETDSRSDINHLEFHLTNDMDSIQDWSSGSQNMTMRELLLLKLVLCSGLYPQLAIADTGNSYTKDSEQAFHTKCKPFVLLHPNDHFSGSPELLLPDEGKEPVDYHTGTACGHQLLAYLNLLETTKPFLIKTLRIPALQTLLLYAAEIDSNEDASRLVFDGWLEVRFESLDDAEYILMASMQLRANLDLLLKSKLSEVKQKLPSSSEPDSADPDAMKEVEEGEPIELPQLRRLERLLVYKLTEFLDSKVRYSVKRIHAADFKHLYKGSISTHKTSNIHPVKGGYRITDYLTFDCLTSDEEWGIGLANVSKEWICTSCNTNFIFTIRQRFQHKATCLGDSVDDNVDSLVGADIDAPHQNNVTIPVNQISFDCPVCKQTIFGTPIEALRHKKSCK